MRAWLPPSALAPLVALGLAACGGSGHPAASIIRHPSATTTARATVTPHTPRTPQARPVPAFPQLLPVVTATSPGPFVPAVRWRGQTAAWIARTATGITLLSFNQALVELHLHSGSIDAGVAGWRYGPAVTGVELRRLAAAFNGGFRLSTGAGGFESYGKVGFRLRPGLGSIVTYQDGTTNIGSWKQEVPAPGKAVASVRQNLVLLIDHGIPASSLACLTCWGATLGGVVDPARAALGVTADGRLIWAAGEHLTVAALVAALRQAGVVRAVELDINPEWVAGYLYAHHGGHGPVQPITALPDQHGIPGEFLTPWSRDFFSITVR